MVALKQIAMVVAAILLIAARAALAQAPAANTCLACHMTLPDTRLSQPAALFARQDVHRESGFKCADCHGGDATAPDVPHAHDAARGFKGKPAGAAVIATCARCHSDAETMRRYAPRQRVDQAVEYATSVHGKQLAAGDTQVATCASCHGAHGVRRVNDAASPVFPTNVASTCARCHANPAYMSRYKRPDGSALPTNQFAEYQKSVHYAAMTRGNDLSAPTCNDCHGNHGAAPPGVGAIANVCGTCHAVFAQKFAGTVHEQIFDKGCVECHSNHAVLKPSDDMLGMGGHAICATCHSGADDKGAAAAVAIRGDVDRLRGDIDRSAGVIARIRNAGIETSAQELALAEARSHLTLARTEMHTFDAGRVDVVVADGVKIVAGVDAAGDRGLAELRFRRRGLAASLVAILMVVVALGLKIRRIERRDSTPQP